MKSTASFLSDLAGNLHWVGRCELTGHENEELKHIYSNQNSESLDELSDPGYGTISEILFPKISQQDAGQILRTSQVLQSWVTQFPRFQPRQCQAMKWGVCVLRGAPGFSLCLSVQALGLWRGPKASTPTMISMFGTSKYSSHKIQSGKPGQRPSSGYQKGCLGPKTQTVSQLSVQGEFVASSLPGYISSINVQFNLFWLQLKGSSPISSRLLGSTLPLCRALSQLQVTGTRSRWVRVSAPLSAGPSAPERFFYLRYLISLTGCQASAQPLRLFSNTEPHRYF